MKNFFRILSLGLFVSCLGLFLVQCKRHRKIDVEGTVTDEYTGQPVSNLRIQLISYIKDVDKYTQDTRVYYAYTDANGKYNFSNAYFSKPNFTGNTQVSDENGNYSSWASAPITEKDAKLIGETKLVRHLVTHCFAKLNIKLNVSNSYAWYLTRISEKFVGSHPIETFNDFGNSFVFVKTETGSKQTPILGYPEGKTILKTEVINTQEVVLVTKYDTISNVACGSTLNHTITVN